MGKGNIRLHYPKGEFDSAKLAEKRNKYLLNMGLIFSSFFCLFIAWILLHSPFWILLTSYLDQH